MKAIRIFQWFCLAVLKPVLIAALVINGIPPTIRATASAVATIAKAINGKPSDAPKIQRSRKTACPQTGQTGSASD